MRRKIARCALLLLAVAAATPCTEAGAQIGGLIKRKVGQAAAAEAPAPPSVGEPVAFGRFLRLDTATYSTLGHEREQPVVLSWNVPA